MMLSNSKLRLGLSFLVLCVFSLAVFAKSPVTRKPATLASAKAGFSIPDIYDAEVEIFNLINRERRKLGIAALQWDDRLTGLSRSYSEQMAEEGFFSHYDSEGRSIRDRFRTLHIKKWRKVGENLFKFSGNADFKKYAIRGWMRSQSHRENLLDYTFTHSGVGIAVAEDGTIYVTQVFMA